MKNIVVLGGTGFVGAHVCEKLMRAGLRVTVPTRRAGNARALQYLPALTVLECDIHDQAALAHALDGADAVVNLVAILHGTPAAFDRVHRALPEKIARVCAAQGVRQLVHVSALGTDHVQPQACVSYYLRSKGEGEAACMRVLGWARSGAAADGSEVAPRTGLTVLRPSVIFGAGDQFLNVFSRLQQWFPVMPLAAAEAKFQPVWVEDVAAAVVQSVLVGLSGPAQFQLYELVGSRVYTLRALVQLAGQLSGIQGGRGRAVIGLPRWMGKAQAALLGLMPGQPLMSADNLDSMQVDNVASGRYPGLQALGITPTALAAVAPQYLVADPANWGLLGIRRRPH